MQKNKEKFIYQAILFFLIVVTAILSYKLFSGQKNTESILSEPASETLAVETLPINPQKITLSKKYIGYVTPINQVDIFPFISGYIEDISAESGKESLKGEELLRIKPDEYIARRDAAEAALTKAEAALVNAKTYYDRILKAGEKAVSKTEVDNALAAFLEAKAAYATAKADLAFAEVTLGYTRISAPIDGINGYINLSTGDYISPGSALFSIIQYDPIRVVFSISDKDYLEEMRSAKIFGDDVIKLKLVDDSIYEYSGKFAFSDNQIDKSTNSIAMFADFANPQKILTANSYVEVIVEKELDDVILVDKKMLILQPDGNFLYVARDNRAVLQKVDLLGETEGKYIVSDNFKKNDFLINSNLQNLQPNIEIHTIPSINEEGKK